MPLHDEQDEDQEKEHEVYGGEKSDKEGETDTEEYEEHGGDESVAAAGDEELEPVSGSKKRIKEIEEEEEDSRKAKAENEMGSAKERRKRPSSLTHVVKSLNNRSNFNQDPSHASLSAYWSYSSSSGSEYEGLIRPGELLLKYLHKDIKPEHVKEFFSGLGVGDNDVIWGRADEEDDDSDEEYITDDGEYITDDGEYNEDSGTDDEEGDKDSDNDVEKSQNVIDKGLLCLVKFGPSSNLKEIRGRLQGEPILGIPVCIGWNGNSRSILFISGFERKLSEKVIRQKIRRKFVKCGKVLKIFIPKKDETSLGFCYVLYDGDLKKAFDMDLTMMEGSTIHVRSAKLKKKICVAHFE